MIMNLRERIKLILEEEQRNPFSWISDVDVDDDLNLGQVWSRFGFGGGMKDYVLSEMGSLYNDLTYKNGRLYTPRS